MPTDDVKAVIDRMRSDQTFRSNVLSIDNVDARMTFIADQGYDCRINDVQHFLRHYVDKDGSHAVVFTEKKGCNGIYYGFCF